MDIFSFRAATWLGIAVVAAGTLGAAGCSSSSSSSSGSASPASPSASGPQVQQMIFGSRLKHTFQANGATKHEGLSKPDDLTTLGGDIFVGFQNGVDSQGEKAPSGNGDGTVVEFTKSGKVVKQWDVTGKIDGLGADTAGGHVIATVNEDGNSSLYAISPSSSAPVHYSYSEKLPHKGGTDSVVSYNGKLLVSASAPGTTGKAPASAPAVFTVTLDSGSKTAKVAPYFADNASATALNGSKPGKSSALALTDPDSSAVVPSGAPSNAGDFELTSQADQEMIFTSGSGTKLSVLKVDKAIDDTAWVTSAGGTLFATDPDANTVDAVTGLKPGSAYSSETPCDAANAPDVCPGPGFPNNSLVQLNLKTGAVSSVPGTSALDAKGLVFVP